MSDNAVKLSWRVRSGSEAAPWVVDEIIKLEENRDHVTAQRDQFEAERNRAQEMYSGAVAENERLRQQLTACGVVAMANTSESAAQQRAMHPDYMSGSCQEVMAAVDREMALRTQRDRLLDALKLYEAAFDDLFGQAGSSPLTTPSGAEVDLTALNKAHQAASGLVDGGMDPRDAAPGGLTSALRQYQHNDGSGVVFGYDMGVVDGIVAQLAEALQEALSFLKRTATGSARVGSGGGPGGEVFRIQRKIEEALAACGQGGEQ